MARPPESPRTWTDARLASRGRPRAILGREHGQASSPAVLKRSGDLSIYLILSRVIADRVGITLRTYEKYIVGNARSDDATAVERGVICAADDVLMYMFTRMLDVVMCKSV